MRTCVFVALLCSTLLASAHAYSTKKAEELVSSVDTPLSEGVENQEMLSKAISMMASEFDKCKPNVCFAIDGSGSISPKAFALQKGFVQLATAVIAGSNKAKARFAATQYADITKEISGLTRDLQAPSGFLGKVAKAKQLGSKRTFVAPGLEYCIQQFQSAPFLNSRFNKIVVLGDGKSNFGDTGRFGAAAVAKRWQKESGNNFICAALVGGGSDSFFRSLVRKKRGEVLRTEDWTTIIDILLDLIRNICHS